MTVWICVIIPHLDDVLNLFLLGIIWPPYLPIASGQMSLIQAGHQVASAFCPPSLKVTRTKGGKAYGKMSGWSLGWKENMDLLHVSVSKVEPFSGRVGPSGECRLATVCTERSSVNQRFEELSRHTAKGKGKNVFVGLLVVFLGKKRWKSIFFYIFYFVQAPWCNVITSIKTYFTV